MYLFISLGILDILESNNNINVLAFMNAFIHSFIPQQQTTTEKRYQSTDGQ